MLARATILKIGAILLLLAGLLLPLATEQRLARCAYVPLLAEELLPNAALVRADASATLPRGWSARAPGVQVGEFAVDGDARSLQLMGIANYVQTPPVLVQPGQRYCLRGQAITDAQTGNGTRLQVVFRWLTDAGALLAEDATPWQPVVLWRPDLPPEHWSPLAADFRAPAGAATLHVRIRPAADDRIYLDALHIRQGGQPPARQPATPPAASLPTVLAWPAGQRAALSLSFDWETAMGGLVHSRSVDDPYSDGDPVRRGLRMRAGITSTLALFQPYGIRATYFATGYNFLAGNQEQVQFLGNPTYAWADSAHGWTSDRWQQTPWFAPDPYGTVRSHPAWYFADLVPQLQAAGQDIQSHTFSHFYGGFVGPQEWRADSAAWNDAAARHGVPPARVLAFPWSSSGGMSDANWHTLAELGITAVTRLSHQSQYNLFPSDARGLVRSPHCRPLPAHPDILACPDFYVTPASLARAIEQIDAVLAAGGMVDLWTHTEEVVAPEQRTAWRRLVHYAATRRGLWIAPLREIAAWQQARAQVEVVPQTGPPDAQAFTIANRSSHALEGLTLRLPFAATRVLVNGAAVERDGQLDRLVLTLAPRQRLEVQLWR